MTDDNAADRFSVLYSSYYRLVLRTCTRRLRNRHAAEDAAHEVFRIAWQHHSQDQLDLAWLYATARNVIGNEYRRSARSAEVSGLFDETAVHREHLSDALDVRAAIAQLREADRELLYLAYWEGLTAREIGLILALSEGAVWVRLSRAREAVRRILTFPAPARSRKHRR